MIHYRIAAAIPTHNRVDDLREAITSVLEQRVEIEIIVVDDGSNPPVDPDCLPRGVRLIRHARPTGPAGARNAAAEAATADWIAFLDDDDRWLPGKAEALLTAIEQFENAAVIFHHMAYRPSSHHGAARRVVNPLSRVLHHQPPHISGVAVRRDIHEKVRFDESMWATQDIDYLIRLAKGSVWVEIPRVLGVHSPRQHPDSAIDLESRIAGRLSLLDRHGELIRGDRRAHSFFYARLGHQYRRADRPRDARDSFLRALRIRPTSRIAWLGLIRLYLPVPTRTGR